MAWRSEINSSRAQRIARILCWGFGALAIVIGALSLAGQLLHPQRHPRSFLAYSAWVGSGFLYFLFARELSRRQRRAVVAAFVISTFWLIVFAAVTLVSSVQTVQTVITPSEWRAGFIWATLLALFALTTVYLGVLIYFLIRSYYAPPRPE
jgi:hypothetical protein